MTKERIYFMKKLCALFALMLLSVSVFVACGKEKDAPADAVVEGEPIPDDSTGNETESSDNEILFC